MNYNILHGFHSSGHNLEIGRLRAAQAAVRGQNPDILVLTEACYGSRARPPPADAMDYGALFGFAHYVLAPRGDHEWGSAILSKFPITTTVNCQSGLLQHVRSTLAIGGAFAMVDVLHPHPSMSESEKASYVTAKVIPGVRAPYILVGDLNSLSPADRHRKGELLAGLRGHVRNPTSVVKSWLEMLTVPSLTSAGLVDTYRKVHPRAIEYTIPTDYLSKDKRSGVRLDYVFVSPDIIVEDAYVLRNASTEIASDHYPVVAVLNMPFPPEAAHALRPSDDCRRGAAGVAR